MLRPIFSRVLAGLLIGWLIPASPSARGELDFDPKPPVKWKDLVTCELVVVGQYKGHKDRVLVLEVARVLKGAAKPGDVLTVALEHRYSVQTGSVLGDPFRGVRIEGEPKLCYEFDRNHGPERVLPEVREPAVYFFPRVERPALTQRGQVQGTHLETGWRQTLEGKPTDLAFRLMQEIDARVRDQALAELKENRDPATLDQLFRWVVKPPPIRDDWMLWPVGGRQAEETLVAAGDRHGDVYGRARRRLMAEPPADPARLDRLLQQLGSPEFTEREAASRALRGLGLSALDGLQRATRSDDLETRRRAEALIQDIEAETYGDPEHYRAFAFGRIMARVDGRWALRDCKILLKREWPLVRRVAAHAIGYVGGEEALHLAFDLLEDPQLANEAMGSVRVLLEAAGSEPPEPSQELLRLRQVARPRLKAALDSKHVPEHVKQDFRGTFRRLLQEDQTPLTPGRHGAGEPQHPRSPATAGSLGQGSAGGGADAGSENLPGAPGQAAVFQA